MITFYLTVYHILYICGLKTTSISSWIYFYYNIRLHIAYRWLHNSFVFFIKILFLISCLLLKFKIQFEFASFCPLFLCSLPTFCFSLLALYLSFFLCSLFYSHLSLLFLSLFSALLSFLPPLSLFCTSFSLQVFFKSLSLSLYFSLITPNKKK